MSVQETSRISVAGTAEGKPSRTLDAPPSSSRSPGPPKRSSPRRDRCRVLAFLPAAAPQPLARYGRRPGGARIVEGRTEESVEDGVAGVRLSAGHLGDADRQPTGAIPHTDLAAPRCLAPVLRRTGPGAPQRGRRQVDLRHWRRGEEPVSAGNLDALPLPRRRERRSEHDRGTVPARALDIQRGAGLDTWVEEDVSLRGSCR